MRKRTQLVGFEFGYWKHVQYCAEFIDNALDAIESFQWRELEKPDSKIKFSLDQELFLEKFSIVETAKEEKKTQHLDNEAKHTLMQELGLESIETEESVIPESKEKLEESGEISEEDELEVEEEVKRIIDDMQEIIKPVENIIDVEPIVIVRIREFEAPSFLTSEISQKNVMSYTFEIFDNGTGMSKIDLRKFGKYLASSKSLELKQTRGSQGFGAPSAFSDAQNTTGKPIIAVSKSMDNVYATVNEFFTTSKNEKKYLIHPTDIDSAFLHGTYIKLNYLNVKYIRGFVEKYIEETAFMNPHITIIYIDPYGKEKIYRRLASSFPREPKYAKPHPSSVNIGDLQDLIAKTEKKTISSFLQDNFVRISSKTAKEIVDKAEIDLQDNLNLLILKDGFVTITQKHTDDIHYLRNEKRIYGRSDKPRDKLIIYLVVSDNLRKEYWDLISKYNTFDKDYEKINKEIKKISNRIEKVETKKEIKTLENKIKHFLIDIEGIKKEKEKIKEQLNSLFKNVKEGITELKKFKNRSDFEDLIREVQISKTNPSDLTREQFNSLFLSFKSIKYMAPPTDTAIPVGDSILENTLIKELGLRISENLDDFDTPVDEIIQISTLLSQEKKFALKKEDPKFSEEISVDNGEIANLDSKILANLDVKDVSLEFQQFKQNIDEILKIPEDDSIQSYSDVFEYFIENYTRDDDFVAAETRDPTSGKGLAYVVEAVLAYSKNIEIPKRSRDVLSRFVNRTPKLRDSADCAITKAVQSVNWKNYNLDTYDNNLPKGPIKLLVNVSGPFVHLMFKSQSKNALADDEDLVKEIKYCLEAIGRKLRIYLNRRASIHRTEKRASLIEKYIPIFVESLYNITSKGDGKFGRKVTKEELEDLMKNAIGRKPPPTIVGKIQLEKPLVKKEEIEKEEPTKIEIKEAEIKKEAISTKTESTVEKLKPKKVIYSEKTLNNWTINELKEYCIENKIQISSKVRKADLIKKIQESFKEKPLIEKPIAEAVVEAVQPEPRVISKPKTIQKTLPLITTERILGVLSNEWQTIKHLIFKLKIKDMMDARYLQLKLKELERKGEILVDLKMGKKHWKLK
ncbi:MAG: DNA topoisomerase VI subunit B [Candidatus Hodarchaeota archaeon]